MIFDFFNDRKHADWFCLSNHIFLMKIGFFRVFQNILKASKFLQASMFREKAHVNHHKKWYDAYIVKLHIQ